MKHTLIVMIKVMVLFWIFSITPILAEQPVYADVSEAGNALGMDLYKQIAQSEPGKNIFISPNSISTALTMTYAGARGKTEEEMQAVMHYSSAGDNVHEGYQALAKEIENANTKGCRLYIANALWGQENYGFTEDFLGLVERYYAGGFNTVNFVGAREEARARINQWVMKNTADKIKELITQDDIDEDTRLVLTNAIYFKGTWKQEFDKTRTRKGPFYIEPEKPVDVDLMVQDGAFSYGEPNAWLQVLELPYQGEDLSMVVLLPRNGLEELENALTVNDLQGWLSEMVTTKVEVILPKFKFQTRYYLGEKLIALGMRDAFSLRADFSGMNGRKDLYIGAVIHQADIDVNEEGTEAAAATAVVMQEKSISMKPRFKADHPFIFLIRHKPTNVILFMGRVMDPNEGKK